MSFKLRLVAIFCMLGLGGCGDVGRVPLMPEALVGTKAVIRMHGKDLTMDIVGVSEKIVTSDLMDWNGQLLAQRNFYRGLYPLAGTEGQNQWEVDFDTALLEGIFPLAVGNGTSFYGNMKDVSSGSSYNFWAKVSVIDQQPFSLPSGTYDVFLVNIITEYEWNGKREKKDELVYFSPDFAMNLKGVLREGASQRYWRVVSIERPGDGITTPTPVRQRRSGTVMI